MNKKEHTHLARLESKLDILETELTHLDLLLRKTGFPQGITTLKNTVEEILSESGYDLDNDGLFA